LAQKVANRELTVRELLTPAPTPTDTSLPSAPVATEIVPVVAERPAYDNSIVIASAALVVLVLAALGIVWWRRGRTLHPSQRAP
jgi:hypothetical protein